MGVLALSQEVVMKLVNERCMVCKEVHEIDRVEAHTGGDYLMRCVNALMDKLAATRRALRLAPDPDRMHTAKKYRRWFVTVRAEALRKKPTTK